MDKRRDYIGWDQYFMGLAFLACERSKDPATQTGAVVVDKDNQILSVGYNGFPTGCSDEQFPWKDNEHDVLKNKHYYVVHSELNAILNAKGRDLHGAKIYVTLFPCNECAKAIIQAGIKTVIYAAIKEGKDYTTAAKRMFDAAGVGYIRYAQKHREVVLIL